jgi:4-hydroxy-2-oxoheptanedioate aldolase
MNSRQLTEALHAGRRVYGTLLASPSPMFVRVVSRLNLDYVFIDTEHVPLDRNALGWMCQTCQALDIAPIVRIPSPDPYQASMALDAGAAGILAPYLEMPEQVQALRGAVKLRPVKGRLLDDYLSGSATPPPELSEYLRERNQQVLAVNIESVPAIEALDEILAVPDLDAVIVGPHDLSCSLGHPEDYSHPDFERAIETIIGKARANKVGVGVHTFYPDSTHQSIQWANLGANLILHRGDFLLFQEGLRRELDTIRASLGDTSDASPQDDDHSVV